MNLIFRKANILIVEDESLIAADISITLNKFGHTTAGIVAKGKDALNFIEKFRPDLILMDITLQGELDGIETAKLINDKYKIPVVYITAHQDMDTYEKTKNSNPYGYITKPLDDKELFSAINTALYRFDAEQKLKRVEEKYFRLTENAASMIYSMNIDNRQISYVNRACFNVTGYTPAEFYENPRLLEFIILPQWKQVLKNHIIELQTGTAATVIEFEIKHKSGECKWLNQRSVISNNEKGEAECIESIVTDITQSKKKTAALKDSYRKLSSLNTHLEAVREEERKHLSREIHDQLGQDLTVLKMGINMLSKQAVNDENAGKVIATIADFKKESNETIDRLITTIRKIASELRPDIIDRLGFKDAVESLASEFQRKSKIRCILDLKDISGCLNADKTITLYRILQEILTNVIRHSEAFTVEIKLHIRGNKLILDVKDNGIGISEAQLENSTSLGIMGMKERVKTLGGTCEITSTVGRGTNVEIKIPELIMMDQIKMPVS